MSLIDEFPPVQGQTLISAIKDVKSGYKARRSLTPVVRAGGIETYSDIVRAVDLGLSEVVGILSKTVINSGNLARTLNNLDVSSRVRTDTTKYVSSMFAQPDWFSGVVTLLANLERVVNFLPGFISDPLNRGNDLIGFVSEWSQKIVRVIVHPSLLLGVGKAIILYIRRAVAFLIFRNPAALFVKTLVLMGLDILNSIVANLGAVLSESWKWFIKSGATRNELAVLNILVPGLSDNKLTIPNSVPVRIIVRAWRELVGKARRFIDAVGGKSLRDVFQNRRTRAEYGSWYEPTRPERRYLSGSSLYPGGYTSGGTTRSNTYSGKRNGVRRDSTLIVFP